MKHENLFSLIMAHPKLKNLSPEIVEQYNELSHAELVAFQKKHDIQNSEIRLERTREDGTKELSLVFEYLHKERTRGDITKYDVKITTWPGSLKLNLKMKDQRGRTDEIDEDMTVFGFKKILDRMKGFMDFQSAFDKKSAPYRQMGESVLKDKKAA